MRFKTAVEKLTGARITLDDVADSFGVARNAVTRWLMPRSSTSSRSAPADWAPKLARLARQRAKKLLETAEQLDRQHNSFSARLN